MSKREEPDMPDCAIHRHHHKGYAPAAFLVLVNRTFGRAEWREWMMACFDCMADIPSDRPAYKLTRVRKKAK